MDKEARAFVKKLLEEGQRYDDVRRALISHGHSTEGFEEEYPEIQKELGIKEPPPSKPEPHHTHDFNAPTSADTKASVPKRKSKVLSNITKLVVGVLIIAAAVIMLSGYGTTLKNKVFNSGLANLDDGLTATDLAHETTLRGMQASAELYRSKLTDYGGVCESIGLDTEAYHCLENTEAYAIEVVLSNDSYYCIDSTGFVGVTSQSFEATPSCQQ